jgi:hypothetical protein
MKTKLKVAVFESGILNRSFLCVCRTVQIILFSHQKLRTLAVMSEKQNYKNNKEYYGLLTL